MLLCGKVSAGSLTGRGPSPVEGEEIPVLPWANHRVQRANKRGNSRGFGVCPRIVVVRQRGLRASVRVHQSRFRILVILSASMIDLRASEGHFRASQMVSRASLSGVRGL